MLRNIVLFVGCLLLTGVVGARPLVIAHRGASGYLPEHTLPAVALAHAMGADYIEQDVVLSRDDVPIVLHDIQLDYTTDVAQQFPQRARADGHYYAIDFDLAEIQQLRVGERRGKDGKAANPGRFPPGTDIFRVPTLEEEIQLIQGLNHSTGREVGIYVELKEPEFHAREGREFPGSVLQPLYANGYRRATDKVYLQCFDAATLKVLREHTSIRLVQLIRDKDLNPARVAQVATYADAVGPWIGSLVDRSDFVVAAQEAGLEVHAYTFAADRLPAGVDSFPALLDLYVRRMQIDGLFTDQPDQVVRYLQQRRQGN